MLRRTLILPVLALSLTSARYCAGFDEPKEDSAAAAVETLPTKITPPPARTPPDASTDSQAAGHARPSSQAQPAPASPAPNDRSSSAARLRRPTYGPLNSGAYFRSYANSGLSQHQIDDLHRLAVGHSRQDAAFYFNQRDMNLRAERLLSAHDQALDSGLQLLKRGDYQRAVLPLTLATKLDQGDPVARIHLAQVRLALGHYGEAAALLRRGLQLQPKLIYMDLQLADYLPQADALTEQTRALNRWTRANPASGEVLFLLGFFEFQIGDFDAANRAFARAAVTLPPKDIVLEYLDITRPADSSADSVTRTRRPQAQLSASR